MKRHIAISTFLALLIALPALAQEYYKFTIPETFEAIYATWINEKYEGSGKHLQKRVYTSWGYGESFKKIIDEKPSFRFTYILVEKWTDSKGNTWYKELEQMLGQKNFILVKVSKDGNTLESIFRSVGFPKEEEMNSSQPSYLIYRKQ